MMAGGEPKERRILRDYVTLRAHSRILSITRPSVTVNNFKLKSALIFMVQQSQFAVHP